MMRQKSHKLGNHAVGVLELHAPDQVRDFVQRTKRSRPIGDGKAGIIAGHQRPGNDQQKGHARREDGKAMMGPVVRYGNGLQKRLLGDCVAPPSRRLSGAIAPARRARRPRDSRRMPALRSKHLRFEALVYGFAVFGGQCDFLGLLAQLFLDKCQRVIARRQALDFILAIRAGDGEERASLPRSHTSSSRDAGCTSPAA